MKTRITELLNVKYPIMQGGMQHLGVPRLAAAVSNAGGIGTINITIYPDLDDFRKAVKEVKSLTDKPFAVNISLVPELAVGEKTRQYIQICKEEGVQIIETAGRSPEDFIKDVKEANIKLIHKCTSVKHAIKAEKIGVDAITVAGLEVAGHPGMNEVGTFVLVNAVAKAVKVPVLAAGGIADGKGLVAALSLGAEGVVLGTRFVASEECDIHQNFKSAIINSTEEDTILAQKSIKNMARYLKNTYSLKAIELEKEGATLEQLMPYIAGRNSKNCYVTGNTQECVFAIGPAMGLIDSIKPVKKIIDEMVEEAEKEVSRLTNIMK